MTATGSAATGSAATGSAATGFAHADGSAHAEPDAPGNRRVVAALDVGGTSMKGALVDASFHVVRELRWPTPRDEGPDAVVESIRAHLAELIAASDERPVAAGVVVPGTVDEARGVAVYSANLGWRDLPLGRMLADDAGRFVALGHDVRAGALAEHRLGAGRGAAGRPRRPRRWRTWYGPVTRSRARSGARRSPAWPSPSS